MTLFISDGPITHVTAPAFHDETPVEIACPVCESPLRFDLIDVY